MLARVLAVVAATVALACPARADTDGDLMTATFAGGCFWCMEHAFDELDGVISTTTGYTGGRQVDPTYKQVSSGATGHVETVQVLYDPRKIEYADLLRVFWRNIDPTAPDRQFCDVGAQYRAVIFYHSTSQRRLAQVSKNVLIVNKIFDKPVVTEIKPTTEFYSAEDYHQDYHINHPIRYKLYRFICGRDKRLKELWAKLSRS
ncbi:MAG: peptide-methionine (S)-S-oxide reductase MsrA [Gammaproteobacteria bacterium]|nr:peptide-methionine (S)-S-oxide reductase MsrA [Gammaproteobacteria bacterium]